MAAVLVVAVMAAKLTNTRFAIDRDGGTIFFVHFESQEKLHPRPRAAASAAAISAEAMPRPLCGRGDSDRIEARDPAVGAKQHHRAPGDPPPACATRMTALGEASSRRRLRRDMRSVSKTRFSRLQSASRSAGVPARICTPGGAVAGGPMCNPFRTIGRDMAGVQDGRLDRPTTDRGKISELPR